MFQSFIKGCKPAFPSSQEEALSLLYRAVDKFVLGPGGRHLINTLENIIINMQNCEKPLENYLSSEHSQAKMWVESFPGKNEERNKLVMFEE